MDHAEAADGRGMEMGRRERTMAKRERGERGAARKRNRKDEGPRKRSRYLEAVKEIDVNDFEFMRQFVTEHGKVIPSRLTGASAKQQRQIKRGIRRARVMGLIA